MNWLVGEAFHKVLQGAPDQEPSQKGCTELSIPQEENELIKNVNLKWCLRKGAAGETPGRHTYQMEVY